MTTPMTIAEMTARIAQLEQEAAIRKAGPAISLKISPKGGLSMYGLGRFPVTLYGSQWDKLIAAVPQIKSFIEANRSNLSVKE